MKTNRKVNFWSNYVQSWTSIFVMLRHKSPRFPLFSHWLSWLSQEAVIVNFELAVSKSQHQSLSRIAEFLPTRNFWITSGVHVRNSGCPRTNWKQSTWVASKVLITWRDAIFIFRSSLKFFVCCRVFKTEQFVRLWYIPMFYFLIAIPHQHHFDIIMWTLMNSYLSSSVMMSKR